MLRLIAAATLIILSAAFFWAPANGGTLTVTEDIQETRPDGYPIATFAGGCFWCVESEFRALDGVLHTLVGYTGGQLENPTYQDIITGSTGHAEALEITFDPEKITYQQLVNFFLTKAHDPTQLNRQGVDVGTQYRSAIYYHDDAQKRIVEQEIKRVDESGLYKDKIVTEISPATIFYVGEEYHQQYYEKYQEQHGRAHIRVLLKKSGQL